VTGHGTDTLVDVQHLSSGTGNDSLTGSAQANSLSGGAGSDTVSGASGNDTLYGGDGNDSLTGGVGDDRIYGGAGADRAYFTGTAAVTVSLSLTGAQVTGHGTDVLQFIEYISSGSGNDRLTGNSSSNSFSAGEGDDILSGGLGNDSLYGADGNDTVYGGLGNDLLSGGSGNDSFVFSTPLGATNVDTITYFSAVEDTIRLENAAFTGLSAGRLAAAAFRSNTTGLAQDTSDRIVFETDTGKLYFDRDGIGVAARVQFAVITSVSGITNADFLVY